MTAADDVESVDESETAAEDIDAEDIDAEDIDAEDIDDVAAPARRPMSHVKMALIAGVAVVVALAGLTGWLAYRTYESNQPRQNATCSCRSVARAPEPHLDRLGERRRDVQRILDSATGTFYDDFQQRAQPFVEVVKQAQSKSTGTIAEAGLESMDDNEAQVLVAVTVRTSNAGAPEQEPRAWRMRILVEKVGDEAKVSNVEFVP